MLHEALNDLTEELSNELSLAGDKLYNATKALERAHAVLERIQGATRR